jgi:hypothetical protein
LRLAAALLCGPAAAFLFAMQAQAAITYGGLAITNACGTRTETSGIGLTQVDVGGTASGLSCSSTARNEAGPGYLKIGAASNVSGLGSSWSQTSSRARFAVNDLVISGPASTASGRMLLSLDGELKLVTALAGDQNAANTSADWLLNINSTFGQGETRGRIGKSLAGSPVRVIDQRPTEGSFGILSGYSGGPKVLELAFNNVPTNTPRSFFLTIYGQSRAQASGCSFPSACTGSWQADSTASIDYMSTLSLVSGRAAFVFDDPGYFANSPSLNVVDN